MGKMKVPEASASPSSLGLPGQGGGEYSTGLKANLIRSRTQGPEECCSPFHPSLGSCLVTAIGCTSSGSDSVSLCPTVSRSFSNRGSTGNSSTLRSSRALTSRLPWNPWVSMEHPLCDAGYLVAPPACFVFVTRSHDVTQVGP